jgi:prepilin-type N-terminal cleavage/methylation domain-containing protein
VSTDAQAPAGFTLIEVLVALVVTGILLALIMNAGLSARERASRAQDKGTAVRLAGELSAAAAASALSPGRSDGTRGRFYWMVDESIVSTDPRGLFALAEMRVSIARDDGAGKPGLSLIAVTSRKLKTVPAR